MSLETALYSLLTGYAPLTTLVGTRIYPLTIPQDVDTPALAYQVISSPGIYTHDGDVGLLRARVQLTVQALTYAQTRDVTAALWALLSGYSGDPFQAIFIDNSRDEWSAGFIRPTVRIDLIVWFRD